MCLGGFPTRCAAGNGAPCACRPPCGPLGAALALIDAYQAQHKDSQQTGADF